MQSMDVLQNYFRVQEAVHKAARVANRNPDEIKIVTVTKGQPVGRFLPLIQNGIKDFGENYPEETEEKIRQLDPDLSLRWHMIGHLQSRKVSIIARYFDVYHSLDRLDLLEKIQSQLAGYNRSLDIMVEVNISGEETKGGFNAGDSSSWSLLANWLTPLENYENLRLVGLMCMPPFSMVKGQNRPYFAAVRKLRDYLQKQGFKNLEFLSMGTSEDFEDAILEGATHIRIGQAILGPRPGKEQK